MSKNKALKGYKKIFAAMMSFCFFVLSFAFYFTNDLSASSLITLSLKSDKDQISVGDIITVGVVADKFPGIVSFGEIDFNFDEVSMEFDGISKGELPESMELAYDESEIENGLIKLYGEDSIVINQLAEQAQMIEDGSIDENTELVNPAFNSESPIVLLNIRFKVKENADEEARFYITNARDFKESNGEFSIINLEDGISVDISHAISNDASITDLRLNGYDMTPAFSPDNMIYEATIGKDVNDVVVTAVTSNNNAQIRVTGNTDLSFGNNTVMVEITAQDGYTKKIYYIIVNRPESLIPLDAGIVDTYGKSYLFAEFPGEFNIPEGFVQTTRTINGYDVPVFARDDVMSVILYLKDENDETNLYFYNPGTRATTLLNTNIVIKSSKVLTPAKIPVASLVPSGFTTSSIEYNGAVIKGYANSKGEFIAYFKDEDGKTQFYQFDEETNEFTEYYAKERTYENEYKVLFLVFVLVALIEGLAIIFIAATINHLRKSRAVPRAKRV